MDLQSITPEMIEALIIDASYYHHDRRVTVCVLHIKPDFYIMGVSGCLDRQRFDETIGEKYALENAKSKIWEYLAYANQQVEMTKNNASGTDNA